MAAKYSKLEEVHGDEEILAPEPLRPRRFFDITPGKVGAVALAAIALVAGTLLLVAARRNKGVYYSESGEVYSHSPYAFATFLSPLNADPEDDQYDGYYESARLINYALQHDPKTRSVPPRPLVVLVAKEVFEWKRQKLRDEGALVMEGYHLTPDWVKPWVGEKRWGNVMMKFNLWNQVAWEKMCFIDADTLVNTRMDDLFDDPAAQLMPVLRNGSETADEDAELPQHYMYAGIFDRGLYRHQLPPTRESMYYMNAGFFCFHPDHQMFKYYMKVVNTDGGYNALFPEQSVLNLVHDPKGKLPWQLLEWHWNSNFVSDKDLFAGVKTLHGKFWTPEGEIGNKTKGELTDARIRAIWQQKHAEMEEYFAGRPPVAKDQAVW